MAMNIRVKVNSVSLSAVHAGLYDPLLTEDLDRSLSALDPISADVLALKGGAAEVITRQLGTTLRT